MTEVQYTALASFYDRLTEDVNYERWAEYLEKLIDRYSASKDIVLELACGTGSLSRLLSEKGYDMICVDNSPDMLAVAREKCRGDSSPLFLCQDMCELDLYGTVDAALCCLDSINYLTYLDELKRAFKRVSLFMNKGGAFIFDIKTTGYFKELKGRSNAVSEEDGFYFWQYDYDGKSGICQHNVEIFQKTGENYKRHTETHFQRSYSFEQIERYLSMAGFEVAGRFKELSFKKADREEGRVFYAARKV